MKIRIDKEIKIDVIMEVFHKNNNTWNRYVAGPDWVGRKVSMNYFLKTLIFW